MEAPVLVNPIPNQVVNERAAYGPFDLKTFIKVPEGEEKAKFTAEVKGGSALPAGMICTGDGILTGIPAKETQGNYEIHIQAQTSGGVLHATFMLTIKPSLADATDIDYIDKLKAQVWQALENRLPVPDLSELYDRPVTEMDLYYLLERWGTLTIWDAFNLEPPGEKRLLNLQGASPHYQVYDRGSCIIAVPKDLFSYERTLLDGIETSRAMAREVYKRNWTIEMAGVDKFTRAAWVEMQHLADKFGKSMEIINYQPTPDDVKIYSNQAHEMRMKGRD